MGHGVRKPPGARRPASSEGSSSKAPAGGLRRTAGRAVASAAAAGVARGLPPAWLGYRWIRHESPAAYAERQQRAGRPVRFETVHPAADAANPLPANRPVRDALPADRGWWGFSFHDVPERPSGETQLVTVRDGLVTWYMDEAWAGDFYPAVITGDGRALDFREVRFRPRHGAALRGGTRPARRDRATWILERVYHNYSHWLTAHLP
jgi:hypothetical protein